MDLYVEEFPEKISASGSNPKEDLEYGNIETRQRCVSFETK